MTVDVGRRDVLLWGAASATALLMPGAGGALLRAPTLLLLERSLPTPADAFCPVIPFDLADLSWRDAVEEHARRPGALVRGMTSWSGMIVAQAILAGHGLRPQGPLDRLAPAMLWHVARPDRPGVTG